MLHITGKNQDFSIVKTALITLSQEDSIIVKKAYICRLTPQGFDLHLKRQDLVPSFLRTRLSLDCLLNKNLSLYIPLMGIDLDVTVTKTQHLGKGDFEIMTEFFADSPTYWRECLFELWPKKYLPQ